jgi:hypothetical protein
MFLFHQREIHRVEIVGFCIIGEIKKSLFQIFQKIINLIFLWSVITFLIIKKIKNKKFWQKLKIMICLFHQPTNPTLWIFFGEKAILEESYEPSLDKLR